MRSRSSGVICAIRSSNALAALFGCHVRVEAATAAATAAGALTGLTFAAAIGLSLGAVAVLRRAPGVAAARAAARPAFLAGRDGGLRLLLGRWGRLGGRWSTGPACLRGGTGSSRRRLSLRAALTAAARTAEAGALAVATAASTAAALQFRRDRLVQHLEHLRGRPEACRRIRNAQHVVLAGNLDGDVGRHAGLQLQVRIGHRNHRRIRHDVLHRRRLEPHLCDFADERVGGVGVDAEGDALTRTHPAHVGFVDVRQDLHLRQVGGHEVEHRRVHAGLDRLPLVDVARDDDAVDRRDDRRIAEVHALVVQLRLGLRQARFRRPDLRVRRPHIDFSGLQLGPRNQLLVRHLLRAIELLLGILERDFQARQVRLRALHVCGLLLDLCLDQLWIETGDDLPLLDDRVEVGVELLHHS